MRLSLIAVAVLGCTLLTHCTDAPQPQQSTTVVSEQPSLDSIYQQGTQALFQARPLSASAYSLSEQQVGQPFAAAMEFYHSKAEHSLRSQMQQAAEALSKVPTTAEQQENQQVMANIFGFYAGFAPVTQGYIDVWMGHSPFIINQINGPIIDMAGALVNSHSIKTATDAQNYLSRLQQFGPALKAVGDKFTTDVQSDWVPPRNCWQISMVISVKWINGSANNLPLARPIQSK